MTYIFTTCGVGGQTEVRITVLEVFPKNVPGVISLQNQYKVNNEALIRFGTME